MRRLVAEPIGAPEPSNLDDLAPRAMAQVPRYRLHAGAVEALDQHLAPVRRRPVDVPAQARLLNATPDLRHVVFAEPGNLLIVTADGHLSVPIGDADSATWLDSGHLLVTAPRDETREEHLAILVDPDGGRILDQVVLDDVYDGSVGALAHPTDGSVLLESGEGQDGSHIFLARASSAGLQVEPILENVVAEAGFSPSGRRLLLTPHPNFDNEVCLLEWPTRERIATITPDRLGIDEYGLDFYGFFLTDDAVVLKSIEQGLILCSGMLEPLAWIELPRPEDAEVVSVLALGPDTFAAGLWYDEATHTTVWRLPS